MTETGKCKITGKSLPLRYMRYTEDGYLVDTQLHCEATVALKTPLLTTDDLKKYNLLKSLLKQELVLAVRILRKMSQSVDDLDVLIEQWYPKWEEHACMELYNMSRQCLDMFQHLIVLQQFNRYYAWVDNAMALPEEQLGSGWQTAVPRYTAMLSKGHKYSDWVTL